MNYLKEKNVVTSNMYWSLCRCHSERLICFVVRQRSHLVVSAKCVILLDRVDFFHRVLLPLIEQRVSCSTIYDPHFNDKITLIVTSHRRNMHESKHPHAHSRKHVIFQPSPVLLLERTNLYIRAPPGPHQ